MKPIRSSNLNGNCLSKILLYSFLHKRGLILDRFKDKAAAPVSRVLSKIGGALESLKAKSPKLYKFGVESLKGLAWMTAGILVYKIIQSGGNIEGLDQVATAVENVAPDAGQAIENVSQAANVEQGIEALQTFDAEARQAIEGLPGLGDQIGTPPGSAMDGASDVITQAVETYPDSRHLKKMLSIGFLKHWKIKLGEGEFSDDRRWKRRGFLCTGNGRQTTGGYRLGVLGLL